MIGVLDSDGNVLLTFRPEKSYSCIVYATDTLTPGATYTLCSGGEYSGGSDTDGVLTGGSWSGYTELGSIEAQ